CRGALRGTLGDPPGRHPGSVRLEAPGDFGELFVAPAQGALAEVVDHSAYPAKLGRSGGAQILGLEQKQARAPRFGRKLAIQSGQLFSRSRVKRSSSAVSASSEVSPNKKESAAGNSGNSLRGVDSMSASHLDRRCSAGLPGGSLDDGRGPRAGHHGV